MKLTKAYIQYGADLGRRNWPNTYTDNVPADFAAQPHKLHLARVYLDSGGYDSGGAYWGMGASLYRAWSEDSEPTIDLYFRAALGRNVAKDYVRLTYPHARFYR